MASRRAAGQGGGVQRILLVLNRGAGTADDEAVEAALEVLRAGADVAVAATGNAAELDEALAAHPDRRLVVLGGDGSVHAAVAALDRAGRLDPAVPVGIVPRGTGNDLAQALGLSLDPAESAAAVLAGVPRPLDLLRDDDGGLVVNAVHVGIGAVATAQAARFKGALGTAAFPLGAAIAGVTSGGTNLRIEVDGEVLADGSTGVLMLGVCNGPTIAGGTPLAPGAIPDDGLADVVVSTATGPVARAAFAAALLNGSHDGRPDVRVVRGRRVSISGPPVEAVADGELQDAAPSRSWRVEPRAWSVVLPGRR
jgi:diacylglycerol kinase family enzyme